VDGGGAPTESARSRFSGPFQDEVNYGGIIQDHCANNRNAVIKGDLDIISDPYFILAQTADPDHEQIPSLVRRPIAVETSRHVGDLQSFTGLGNRRTRHNKTLGEALEKLGW
jgi:hypothetical protein